MLPHSGSGTTIAIKSSRLFFELNSEIKSAGKGICLITPGHLSSTPRLVREADILVEVGYEVHVVAGRYHAPSLELDEHIIKSAKWNYHPFTVSSWEGLWGRLSSRVIRKLVKCSKELSLESRALALFPITGSMIETTRKIRADLYFGHTPVGLVGAVLGSQYNNQGYGFDWEDYHELENIWNEPSEWKPQTIQNIFQRCIEGCAIQTAASPLIAEKVLAEYGMNPGVVLNTYPINNRIIRQPTSHTAFSEEQPARIYWFSQTVGAGRGLEEALKVIARCKVPCELTIRGFVSDTYRRQIQDLSERLKIRQPLFGSPVSPEDVVAACEPYDLGLCLECKKPENRNMCLPNKIFAYLLQGLPVWLSATDAHQHLATELGKACVVTDISRIDEAASMLDEYLSRDYLEAREHAYYLGETRFHWEEDAHVFLTGIKEAIKVKH